MDFGKRKKKDDIDSSNEFYDDEGDAEPDDEIGSTSRSPDEFGDNFGDDGFNDGFGAESPSTMERFPELLKGMTDFEVYKRKLFRGWMGITWDAISRKFKPNPDLKKIMNIKGSNWAKSLLETYSRNNNILAQLKDSEQNDIINGGLTDTLFSNLADNYYDFDFENASAVLRVWNELDHGALLAISGSDGSYSKVLAGREGGMMQYREGNMGQMSQDIPKKKRGFIKTMFGLGK